MKRSTVVLLAAIGALASVASLIASSSPDGLNRVAADLGFSGRQATLYQAPLAGYSVPLVPSSLSGVAAGLLGTAAVGGVAFAAGKLLARPSRP